MFLGGFQLPIDVVEPTDFRLKLRGIRASPVRVTDSADGQDGHEGRGTAEVGTGATDRLAGRHERNPKRPYTRGHRHLRGPHHRLAVEEARRDGPEPAQFDFQRAEGLLRIIPLDGQDARRCAGAQRPAGVGQIAEERASLQPPPREI